MVEKFIIGRFYRWKGTTSNNWSPIMLYTWNTFKVQKCLGLSRYQHILQNNKSNPIVFVKFNKFSKDDNGWYYNLNDFEEILLDDEIIKTIRGDINE